MKNLHWHEVLNTGTKLTCINAIVQVLHKSHLRWNMFKIRIKKANFSISFAAILHECLVTQLAAKLLDLRCTKSRTLTYHKFTAARVTNNITHETRWKQLGAPKLRTPKVLMWATHQKGTSICLHNQRYLVWLHKIAECMSCQKGITVMLLYEEI